MKKCHDVSNVTEKHGFGGLGKVIIDRRTLSDDQANFLSPLSPIFTIWVSQFVSKSGLSRSKEEEKINFIPKPGRCLKRMKKLFP